MSEQQQPKDQIELVTWHLADELEKFWLNVNKNGSIPGHISEIGNCWEWTSGRSGGYGSFVSNGKTVRAHRWLYQVMFGSLQDGVFVCHKCDNRRCVRPEHLFTGTLVDNNLDCAKKGRIRNGNLERTHCKRGHEFTPENTVLKDRGRKNPERICLICRRAMNIIYKRNARARGKV